MFSLNNVIPDLRKSFFLYFFIGCIAIYFIFSAALNIPFYHHDIYKYSIGGFHQACVHNQSYALLVSFGRPVSAYLDCYNNKIGITLAGMNIMRFVCIGLTGLMISLFALLLRRLDFSWWAALFVSMAVFVLPVTMVTIIMGCTTLIVAIITAFLSQRIIGKIDDGRNQISAIVYLICGLALLFFSFFTYPALTAFYLMPAFVTVLFNPLTAWPENGKKILRDILIYGVGSVIYFFLAKELQSAQHIHDIPLPYQFHFNFHYLPRIRLLSRVLPVLWNLDAGMIQDIIIYGIIALGLLSAGLRFFIRHENYQSKYLFQAVVAAIVLLLQSASAFLAAPIQDIPITRTIFVFQAMSLLILFWSIFELCSWFPKIKTRAIVIVAALLCLTGAFYSNAILTSTVLNDYVELNYVVTSIANQIKKNLPIKRIHVIAPAQSNYNNLAQHEDIFNYNSAKFADDIFNIVNTAFLQLAVRHTFDLKQCVQFIPYGNNYIADEMDCINATPSDSIAVTYSQPGIPVSNTPDTLIIDMRFPEIWPQKINYQESVAALRH